MPDRSRPALGLAAVIGALLLAGCGSSSNSSSAQVSSSTTARSSSGGPSKAQFVAQAQAICRSLSAAEKPLEERQAALKGEATSSSGATFVTIARQVVALSKAADAKLHALARPAADAVPISKLLASFSMDVAYADALAQAAAKEENDVGEAAERGLRRSIAANAQLAREYGVTMCTGAE